MAAHLAPGPIESDLVTQQPEPASGKIMRRSLLVVLSIVIGLGIATVHMALTTSGRTMIDLVAGAAVAFVVARHFSYHSPERWAVFALALTLPALGLAIAFGAMGRDVARTPMWYVAPVIWLAVGGLAAILGQRMAAHDRLTTRTP